jgi:Cu/Ag efflux protein CusF
MSKNRSFHIWVTALAIVLFTTLFPAKAAAQSGYAEYKAAVPASYQGQTPPAGQRQEIQGTLTKVDIAGNKLTVRTERNQEQTFALDSRTEVQMSGKPATTADLKEGQQVTIVAEGVKALGVIVVTQTASKCALVLSS